MKQFAAFVLKEFLHILRDRRTLLILLGMPVALILIFGFAISTEVRNIRLSVLDHARTPITSDIVEKIAANSYFTFVDFAQNKSQIEHKFREGKIDVAIVFGSNFESDLKAGRATLQILADGSDPNSAQASVWYMSAILQNYLATQVEPTTPSQGAMMRPVTISPELKLLYNPQMVAAYNFVPGVMGMILMLICAMMTAIAIVREKERGTMEVLLASPLRPVFIILAKVTPYLVLSMVNVLTIIVLAVTVFSVPIMGSIWALTAFCVVFTFTALALGILISSMVSSQVTAMIISGVVLLMPTNLLSGLIFPIDSMPMALQYVSMVIPARWFIDGIRKIMIQGVEIQYAAKELLILCSMASVLVFVSLKKFRNRL